MGFVYADITIASSFDVTAAKKGLVAESDVKKMCVKALVDTGAMTLIINDEIAAQLDLEVKDRVTVELADGSRCKRNLVGPIDIYFKNRQTSCLALVIPGANEVLLGVIPIEGMDVIIDPILQQLALPPERPYHAGMKVK